MENFGILCGLLFWGPVILLWLNYLKKGKPSKPLRYIGNGFFLAFIVLILGGCGKMMLEGSLTSAAFEGDTATVERLINMGVDVNARDENWDYTPLMCAASNGHTETVKALLRHHPDLKYKTRSHGNMTAVGVAIQNGHPDIVPLLEAAGPSY